MARKATVTIYKTVKFVVALDLDELVDDRAMPEGDVASDAAVQDFADDAIYDELMNMAFITAESQSTDHVEIRRYNE